MKNVGALTAYETSPRDPTWTPPTGFRAWWISSREREELEPRRRPAHAHGTAPALPSSTRRGLWHRSQLGSSNFLALRHHLSCVLHDSEHPGQASALRAIDRLFDVGLSRGSSNIPLFNTIFGAKRPIACLQLRARLPSPWIPWSQSSLLRPHSHGAAQRQNFAPQRSRLFRAPKFAPDARRNRLRDLVERVCTVSLYASLYGTCLQCSSVYRSLRCSTCVLHTSYCVRVLRFITHELRGLGRRPVTCSHS